MVTYRREIDGLRAVAVLPVLFFHAGFSIFAGGFIGVDIFFVISGYLITSILLKEMRVKNFSLLNFYERRARRILPPLFLVMLCCIPAAFFLMVPNQFIDFSESLAATSLFSSNFLFWSESGYFAGPSDLKPLLHTWSLAVEEQYYLLFPLFLMITWPLGFKKTVTILIFLALCSLGFAHYTSSIAPGFNFYLLPSRGWELLIGAFAAYFLINKPVNYKISSKFLNEAMGIFGLLLIIISIILFDESTPFPSLWSLIPTLGTVFIILFASPRTLVGKLLGAKLLVSLGLISYGAYLWHQPIFAFARIYKDELLTTSHYIAFIVISFFLAFISWKYVENYFRNKSFVSGKRIFQLSGIFIVFFISFAFISDKTDGMIFRFINANDQFSRTIDEESKYTEYAFNQRLLKPWEISSPKTKILIIGDSFAQDMTNVLLESSLALSSQVSTYYIMAGCGNYMLESYEELNSNSSCKQNALFTKYGRAYANPLLLDLMLSADQIWIISSWDSSQIHLLKTSIDNIQAHTKASLKFFSRKDFGKIDINNLIHKTPKERADYRFALSSELQKLHQEFTAQSTNVEVIDLYQLYCDSKYSCKIADLNGYLYSWDGTHLTREGVKYFAKFLDQEGIK